MSPPKHRIPTETSKAHAAFVAYRDLGDDRSLAKAAQQLGKSTALLERWSQKYDWVARVRAWEIAEDERLRDAMHKERRAMCRRIAAQSVLAQTVAVRALKTLGEQALLSPGEASHLLDVGSRLEMKSRGMPDEDQQYASVTVIVSKRPPEPYREGLSKPRNQITDET